MPKTTRYLKKITSNNIKYTIMKKVSLFIAGLAIATGLSAQTLQTDVDSASYALGSNTAMQMMKELETVNISKDLFLSGFSSVFKGEKQLFTPEESMQILQNFFSKMQEAEQNASKEKCMESELKNQEFFQKNKTEKGVVTLENGLQYKVVKEGKGTKPTENNVVKLHYKGTLIDGTVFDSSLDRGEPVSFPVNAVIPGFSQVLQLMTPGSTYIAYIPSELGYGVQDMGVIPACSALIFEIQLIDVVSSDSNAQPTDDASADTAKKSKKEKKNK